MSILIHTKECVDDVFFIIVNINSMLTQFIPYASNVLSAMSPTVGKHIFKGDISKDGKDDYHVSKRNFSSRVLPADKEHAMEVDSFLRDVGEIAFAADRRWSNEFSVADLNEWPIWKVIRIIYLIFAACIIFCYRSIAACISSGSARFLSSTGSRRTCPSVIHITVLIRTRKDLHIGSEVLVIYFWIDLTTCKLY